MYKTVKIIVQKQSKLNINRSIFLIKNKNKKVMNEIILTLLQWTR